MGFFETRYNVYAYEIFRILIGGLFFMHGLQKLLLIWGVTAEMVPTLSMGWWAGVFEVMIGLSLLTGVLVRLASGFGVIMMGVAFSFHASTGGLNPLLNQGEPALLLMLAFLATLAYGSQKWSLEKLVFKKEYF